MYSSFGLGEGVRDNRSKKTWPVNPRLKAYLNAGKHIAPAKQNSQIWYVTVTLTATVPWLGRAWLSATCE